MLFLACGTDGKLKDFCLKDTKMQQDSLIIYSGGMDSTTLLYEYKDVIGMAISFNYGSKHNDREFEYAEKYKRIRHKAY